MSDEPRAPGGETGDAAPSPSPHPPLTDLPKLLAVVFVVLLVFLAGALVAQRYLRKKPRDLVEEWISALKGADAGERHRAALKLGVAGDARFLPRVIPALIGALGDEDRQVRDAAVRGLHRFARLRFGERNPPHFDPDAPEEERAEARAEWKEWWRARTGPSGKRRVRPLPR